MTEPAAVTTRAARQYLASLRRAGVTHLPACDATVSLAETDSATDTNSANRQPDPPQVGVVDAGHAKAARASEVVPNNAAQTPPPALTPTPVHTRQQQTETLPVSSSCPGTRPEREAALSQLALRVAACTLCEELARTRTQTVFGVGNPEARIMFIGEAPGADEDKQGEPFVGRAGKLLNDIIAACRMEREDIYICNILRCRPPGNRNPTPVEASHCREFLDGQIAIVDPDYIVCWGSIAAQNLLSVKTPIGRMRQQFFEYGRARVICTYHPAYLIRNESAKRYVWDDMKMLMKDMGIDPA